MMRPPASSVDILTEVLHGVTIADPYRWLEEQHSPQTRNWLKQQTAYTKTYFAALTNRDAIRERVQQLLAPETILDPWKVGGRYFYLRRPPHAQQPAIVMRERCSGSDIVLVDPTKRDPTGRTAVGILSISRDGRLLAYSVRRSGSDGCTVELLDVDHRLLLEDSLPHGFCRGLVFRSDPEGFYYSHEPIDSGFLHHRAVFWHALGTERAQDTEVFDGGDDPSVRLALLASPSAKRLGYCKFLTADTSRIDFFLHNIASGTPPHPIVQQIQGVFSPILLEDSLFAITDWQAPNCRVVQIDANSPEPRNWREVIPESDARIGTVAIVGNRILVTTVKDLVSRLEMFDLSGSRLRDIPLPCQGTASVFPSRSDTDTVFIHCTSFTHPPSILCHDLRTQRQKPWPQESMKFDPSSIEMAQIYYPAKDGTPIPLSLVFAKGQRAAFPLPTFLTGYGGFGKSVTPRFTAYAAWLVERGCLFAVANLRGGTEFGTAWHVAAKRQNRQVAIDDFLAAAEWLLSQGYSQQGRLAIGGGSNAGLLVAAALTQRPDLFRAVICLGPLLDMLRYHLFDCAIRWNDEYGSAELESDFRALLRYSPYHAVQNAAPYPAVLFISGDADTRCNPMHVRKMTARLQAATSSGNPILLEYSPVWGHTPVQPLTTRVEMLTNRLAFLCHELGLNP